MEDKNITNITEETAENTAEAEALQTKENEKESEVQKTKKQPKNKRGLKEFLKSRKARYGAVSTAIVIITVAVVIVLNIVVSLLVDRFPNLKLDLTANSAYELNEDTADYMSHLDKDVDFNILSKEEDFIKNDPDTGKYFKQFMMGKEFINNILVNNK